MTGALNPLESEAVLSAGRNLTKARVATLDWHGQPAVSKSYRHRPWWVRRVLGPWFLNREQRALLLLDDVEGVPTCRGRPQRDTLILSYVPGRTLRTLIDSGLRPAADFFPALRGLIDRMHQAGVAQGDIGLGDVLVRPDGSPALIDFSVSVVRGRGVLGRLFFGRAVAQDRRRLARLKSRFETTPAAAPATRRSRFLGRLRLVLLALLLAFWAVVGRPRPLDIWIGLPLVLTGSAVRFWAAGYLLKTKQLSTAGPYAYCRHPLYLGRLLLFSGFGVMARLPGGLHWLILGIGWVVFFSYYLPRKERVEGRRLEDRHGGSFRRYRDAVPALWPGKRWPEASTGPSWQLGLFLRNREFLMLVLEGALLALLISRAFR